MSFARLERDICNCTLCPRLVAYRAEVGALKRKAYSHCEYWAKPVPGFGDPSAGIWIVGLAPGAHGANRTGRVFTGDRSGDFLFAALHRCGLANQPVSRAMDDGLVLSNVFISATARCAPPGNKPLPSEVENCRSYLDREWKLLRHKRVILALGAIAWNAAIAMANRNQCGPSVPSKFAHGAEVALNSQLHLLGSYHVSQQNTFTGRLTTDMFDRVLRRCLQFSAAP
jgi:uracil-DNA glycosylase family 4